MLFAFAITARGELAASALGSDWRVWQLQEKNTNGLGVSQTSAFASGAGQACRRTRVWLITWRPSVQIETSVYDDCGASEVNPVRVAWVGRWTIIGAGGGYR